MPETVRGGRDFVGAKLTPFWSLWSLKSSQGDKH